MVEKIQEGKIETHRKSAKFSKFEGKGQGHRPVLPPSVQSDGLRVAFTTLRYGRIEPDRYSITYLPLILISE